MKTCIFNSIVLFSVCFFFSINSFCQTNQSLDKEIDDLINETDIDIDEEELLLENSIDTDGDDIPDVADLCPEQKGSLPFHGCAEISADYIWDYYEYEEYPASSELVISPAKFETVTTTALQKPSHNEGASFEKSQKTYAKKAASTKLEVVEAKLKAVEKEVLIDEITGKKAKIVKHQFATRVRVKEVAIPAEEDSYVVYKLIEDGQGAPVEAQYITLTKEEVVSPASVKEVVIPAVKKGINVRKSVLSKKNYSNETIEINTKVDESDEPEIFQIVEIMPTFPDGDEQLLNFLHSNLEYPEEAKKEKIEGLVVLSFIVGVDGSLTDIEILRDIGGGCGDEAARCVSTMPNWLPGKQRGIPVYVAYKLPIRFKLDNEKK